MATETHNAAAFYASPRGRVAARLLRHRLSVMWPKTPGGGGSMLGIGYPAPYLGLWRTGTRSCIALTPAPARAARWPRTAPNLTCSAEEDGLPFADMSFDRILLVHGLELAGNGRRLLREIWRVLKDDGRLLVVVPNRRGLWAHVESTPFGHGQPYSPGQLGRLLTEGLFRVDRRDAALFVPPLNSRVLLRGARIWDAAGRQLLPSLAGVTIVDAAKQIYAGVSAKPAPRRRMVMADAA